MVTWAPSQPLMYLTVPVPLICVTERVCLAFFGGGFSLQERSRAFLRPREDLALASRL